MKTRPLGKTGLNVAPLAFGGNVFGWTVDEPTSFRLLDAFVDAGLNLVDTADVYSRWAPGNQGGESETILGKWFKASGKRDRVVLATKVGMDLGDGKTGLARPRIIQAVDESLRRLQTEHIDLYQAHKDDESTPLEETLGTFADLIQQGKVRAIGASNYTSQRLAEALAVSEKSGLPRYQTLQPHDNLCERKLFEADLEQVCLDHELAVIPYFSLANGFLTGKYRSEADMTKSTRGERVKKYLNPKGFQILDALDQVAARYQSNPARVALAWLAAQPTIVAPIASVTSLDQLTDLIESARLELDAEAIERLTEASDWRNDQDQAH